MLLWILIAALPALFALCGFALLRRVCGRRELPEGWEDEWIARRGGTAWQEAARAGREWLDRHETEEIEVQSDDGFLLHGLLIPHVEPRGTAILFHGWRSSWELDFLPALPFLHSLGLQLLLTDERAQGDSEGRWMTLGVREKDDVPVWTEYAAGRFGAGHPLFLFGSSMGAAALLLASGNRLPGSVRGVVSDCGYVSPYEAAGAVWRERTPLPAHLSMWLLDLFTRLFADFSLKGCDAREALAGTEYPMLFLYGTADRFIPGYMTRQAFEACAGEKTLAAVEGAGHCMSYLTGRKQVEAAVADFVRRHL